MARYDINGNLLDVSYDIHGTLKSTKIGVMTYNIELGTTRNTQSVIKHIVDTYKPDIIGVQEIGHNSASAAAESALEGYTIVVGKQSSYKTGLASLNASYLSGASYSEYSVSGRGYQVTPLAVGDKTIMWYNTHLATSATESAKVAQAQELFEIATQNEYFIITGDFNTVCKSTSAAEYPTMIKPFEDYGCNSVNCFSTTGFTNTWTDTLDMADGYPCDQIITSSNISIDSVVFDQYKIGLESTEHIDHIPVYAVLEIHL